MMFKRHDFIRIVKFDSITYPAGGRVDQTWIDKLHGKRGMVRAQVTDIDGVEYCEVLMDGLGYYSIPNTALQKWKP